MIKKKRTLQVIIMCIIFATISLAEKISIKIIGTSDVHGRIAPWNYSMDVEDFSGSYAQISSYVEKMRGNNEVILVDIGDIIQDNFIERFINEKPHPAIQVLNYMKYDIIVPGNHEFNFGMDALTRVLSEFNGTAISSNIFYKNGAKAGESYIPPTKIIEKDGIKIGFIGATTPLVEVFEADTGHVKNMRFAMPIPEIKKQVQLLKDAGVDAIVLLAHMGLSNENNIAGTGVTDIANQIPELDIIIAGHEHQNISKKVINGVYITEPHRYGTMVSVVDLVFEKEANQTVKLIDKDTKTVSVKDDFSDNKVTELYDKYHKQLVADANIVIGETKRDLVPQVKIKGIPAVYMQDTGLSTLINEVQLYYSKADVTTFLVDNKNAILNKGKIKKKDIANNYQYTSGETTVYEFTGKQLKAYMEWSAGYFASIKSGDKEYQYDSVRGASKYMTYDLFGGVKYTIDLTEPEGKRIKNLTLANGKVITDNMKIKVGMNSYRYEMLAKKGGPLEGANLTPIWDSKTTFGETEGTIRNMVIRYIRDVQKGKIEGTTNNYWKVVGL